jgi:hypothetical protein
MSLELAEQLADAISSSDELGVYQQLTGVDWLAHAPDESIAGLFRLLVRHVSDGRALNERILAGTFRELVRRAYSGGSRRWKQLSAESRPAAVTLYRGLGPGVACRYLLLQLLAVSRNRDDLAEFADLVATDPPTDVTAAAVAFGPLLQHKDYDPAALFPRLLDALCRPAVAPAILDVANFVTRERLADKHPASARKERLADLLGALIQHLGQVEERPVAVAADQQKLAEIVVGSISLAVSLCDALALIGDRSVVGKLYQALDLRHRRLRTEAAAALARLGEEDGRAILLSMAAEPVARLRVLAYAAELGIEDLVDEKYTTSAARAESELALWLAQPAQLGFPPSRMELVDTQTLYWPGYDEPMECFLFRFAYEVPHGSEYTNIGIAGPLCHAFGADLADLPPDDIYAVFAGWQVEHEEIYELDAAQLTVPQHLEVVRLERRLHDGGYTDIQPVKLGVFFGERVLVARAVRDGLPGVAVATLDEVQWHTAPGRPRPLGPHEAYCLYKGRKLLRTFNA